GNPNLPVENVSWLDVQPFIEKLNTLFPDLHANLPTEAQWEYACRAGTQTPFSFGENITPEQVNYDGNYPYAGGETGLFRERTVPVKSLPPNPWGLYEMHGNVWEWCADWYEEYPTQAVTNPLGPDKDASRVLRGGSWSFIGRNTRSANRGRLEPDLRYNGIGFRLAPG
ncbi:MAG: formylglycine-generating enzyme family protein, partial [Nitrosomonas sp.]|nr:formylglycine-generating enzyme family protein [Nitrosomonas sp.]